MYFAFCCTQPGRAAVWLTKRGATGAPTADSRSASPYTWTQQVSLPITPIVYIVFPKGCVLEKWCVTRTVEVCRAVYLCIFYFATNVYYFKFLDNFVKNLFSYWGQSSQQSHTVFDHIVNMNQIFWLPTFLCEMLIINYLHEAFIAIIHIISLIIPRQA